MSLPPPHVIVGAGHNGLVCAIQLARKGKRVLLLEAAQQVGGASVTREFATGFRVSAGAHLLDVFPAELMIELQLEQHGLRFAARDMPILALDVDGAPVELHGNHASGLDQQDLSAYREFNRQMARFTPLMRKILRTVPFRLALGTWRDRWTALRLALGVRMLGRADMRELLRIAGMNAYDLLNENFKSDLLKGALAFDACLGAEYSARSPGTVLNLLYRRAGQAGAGTLGTALPLGGMGSITEAMAKVATAAGVEIRTGAKVVRIQVTDDRASGVLLETGEQLAATAVISNADPRTTFLKLLGPEHLDTDFVRRIDHFRARGLVAKIHLGLIGLPVFKGVGADKLGSRLLISPSLDYLEHAFNPSKYREIPTEPALEIIIPTVADPSLAPAGAHVLSINVMFIPFDLGPDPERARSVLMENVLSLLERYAPGIRSQITARELLAPVDLEREFGMTGGHWHHGALSFDQFFFNRPVPGAADHRSPVPGLFLCGAGSHPGGGVMGIAGRNAARVVLETRSA